MYLFPRILLLLLLLLSLKAFPQISGAGCPNASFSFQNFTNWVGNTGNYNNPSNATGIVNGRHTIITAANTDPNTCNGLLTLPPGSAVSARLGNQGTGAQAERLSYTIVVDSSNALFIYKYAVVMEDPDHIPAEQPKFDVQLLNSSGQQIGGACGAYSVTAAAGVPGFQDCGSIRWKDWSVVGLNLLPWYGQQVTLQFTTFDCSLGGHFGYAYIAADCRPLTVDVNYCLGDNQVTLIAPPGFATYSWNTTPVQNNDTLILNNPTNGDTLSVLMTSFTNTGTCPVTLNAVIQPTIPIAGFDIDSQCVNTVSFLDTSIISNGFIQSWLWDFGDNSTSNQQHPSHTYAGPGVYTVSLIVYSRPGHTGCSDTVTRQVTIVPPLTASITPNPAFFCVNDAGIQLNAQVSGGATPYSITWFNGSNGTGSPVGTGTTYFAPSAGNYSIVVTDSLNPGCPPTIANRNVTTVPLPVVNAGNNIVACPGVAIPISGSVTNATGGTWSGGSGTFANANNLSTTYTPTLNETTTGSVTLTLTSSGNGVCNAVSDQVTILFTQPLVVNVSPDIFCYGSQSQIAATVTGGTPPYNYLWNTGATTQTLSGVPAGTYSVTVTDNTPVSCSTTGSVNLTQNPQINLIVPGNSLVSCDSSVLLTISATGGGGGTYSYLWSTGATTTSITVPPGSYVVSATDTNNCSASDTIVITSASASLAAAIPQPGPVCDGATTLLSANATGGFGNYTYLWTNGATTATTNASGGTHCVTVTDSAGCVTNACIGITEYQPMSVVINGPPLICNGSNTTLSATASGGSGAYTFLWNTAATTNSISVPAGSYSVTASDTTSNNCTATYNFSVNQATPVSVSFNSNNPSCFMGSNGQATAIPSGGVPGYSYLWPVSGSTSNSIFGLTAGSYLVQVTDSMGCIAVNTVNIGQPNQLQVNINPITAATCFGASNGSATANVSGGTGSYSYFWSPGGATTAFASGFPAGLVTVNVLDSLGCQASASGIISQPSPVSGAVASATHNLCYGQQIGAATVSGNGGSGPYQYLWPNGNTSATATGLGAGVHTVTITDNAGCVGALSVIITQPPQLIPFVTSVQNNLCHGDSTGEIGIAAYGGVPFYTYNWNPVVTTGFTASNLTAGVYSVTVTDSNGCQASLSQMVTQPQQLLLAATSINPSCENSCNGQVLVIPSGGTPQYQYLWSNGTTTAAYVTACEGTYDVVVTDSMGCTADTTLTVTDPPLLTVSTSVIDAHCSQNDGSASVIAAGGTPNYSYQWQTVPLQTTATATGLPTGSYIVTVTDQKNCTASDTVFIADIPGIDSLTFNSTSTLCNASCDGSASVTAHGGSAPYVYQWTNGGNNPLNSNLCSGTYGVIVTDDFGCTFSDSIIVAEPDMIVLNTLSADDSICIGEIAQLSVVATGGNGVNYNYSWNSGQFTGSSINVSPGTTTYYFVTATDQNNCSSAPDTLIVFVYQPVMATAPNDSDLCLGGTAVLSANTTGGNGQYTYLWTPGNFNTPSISVIPTTTTTYYLTVTDNCGSPSTGDSVVVTVNPLPVVDFTAIFTSGCRPLCVDFADLTTLISGNVTGWVWDFGDGTSSTEQQPNHCFHEFGDYDVTLTAETDEGCISNKTYQGFIKVYSDPVAEFFFLPEEVTSSNPNVQFNDISLDAVQWDWDFDVEPTAGSNQRNPHYFYPDTGTYCPSLIVTNTHGCQDSTTSCFDVKPEWTIYIPNAFTPNRDLTNPEFRAYGVNILEFEMVVYDRWGLQIFNSTNMEDGWDGTFNGNVCPIDVYVYKVRFEDLNGRAHIREGHVSLIR